MDTDIVATDTDIDHALTRIELIEKTIAQLQAEQAHLIAAVTYDPDDDKEFFREELRAVLGQSAAAISSRVSTAWMLVHKLPGTLAALETGELTMRHVEALCTAVAGLADEDAVTIQAACVPFAVGRDYTAFVRKVRREVQALDSRTTEQRFRAAIENRRVWHHRRKWRRHRAGRCSAAGGWSDDSDDRDQRRRRPVLETRSEQQ